MYLNVHEDSGRPSNKADWRRSSFTPTRQKANPSGKRREDAEMRGARPEEPECT